VQLQITAQLFTCWSRYCCSAFDRQHDDAASTLKDRHRKSGDAGLLGAAIPRNQYIPSHLKLGHWRRNQDRSAAFKQASFKCGHPRALRIATGLAQDNHIEDPTVAADKEVTPRGIVQPTA